MLVECGAYQDVKSKWLILSTYLAHCTVPSTRNRTQQILLKQKKLLFLKPVKKAPRNRVCFVLLDL